jgi:alkaline phosphatase
MSFRNTVKKIVHALPTASCVLLATAASLSYAENGATDIDGPRHVILIIGDGMDDQQITIARNYLSGAAGRLLLDEMPLRASSQIMTIEDKVDGKPVYVADSANTATTMASGELTSRGRIATRAGSNQPIPTIVEMAEAAGYKTGLVSTASVTDATPAAFATHISLRMCENPQTMLDITYKDIHLGECKSELKANGGPGSIAEQLVDSDLDVILGGGAKHIAMSAEASTDSVADIAKQKGFQLVTTPAELASAMPQKRLLGLFSPGTMPVRLQGENERTAEEPEPSLLHYVHRYLGEVTLPAPMHCEPNPAFAGIPSLKAMTDTAIAQLSHDNIKGFFLMVESASIDKQSHERKPCGSIGELQQLNEALASALAFADQNPNTLILVTADHAQAAQIIPNVSLFAEFPIPIYTPGKLARIITPEGSVLAVNYATNNFPYAEHTGASVPLFANSEGVGVVPAFLQQRDIFAISRDYLKLD